MQLYAKTTSERASKGQGGNEFIEIDINIGEKTYPRYRFISQLLGGQVISRLHDMKNEKIVFEEIIKLGETKGKSEPCKAVTGYHEWCDSKAVKDGYCKIHYEENQERQEILKKQKGKSQKGEEKGKSCDKCGKWIDDLSYVNGAGLCFDCNNPR